MPFDLTISLGNLVTVIAFIGGAFALAYSIKSDMKVADMKYTIITANMDDFKIEIKNLTKVITEQALQTKRMDYLEERLTMSGGRLDDVTRRFNEWSDSRDSNMCPAHRPSRT